MDEKILGSYTLSEKINYKNWLNNIGIGPIGRMLYSVPSESLEITKDGKHYTMKSSSLTKKRQVTFKPNVPAEDVTVDNWTAESNFKVEDNKIYQRQMIIQPREFNFLRDPRAAAFLLWKDIITPYARFKRDRNFEMTFTDDGMTMICRSKNGLPVAKLNYTRKG